MYITSFLFFDLTWVSTYDEKAADESIKLRFKLINVPIESEFFLFVWRRAGVVPVLLLVMNLDCETPGCESCLCIWTSIGDVRGGSIFISIELKFWSVCFLLYSRSGFSAYRTNPPCSHVGSIKKRKIINEFTFLRPSQEN